MPEQIRTIDNQIARHSPDDMEPFLYVPGVLWAADGGTADQVAAELGNQGLPVTTTQPDPGEPYLQLTFPPGGAASDTDPQGLPGGPSLPGGGGPPATPGPGIEVPDGGGTTDGVLHVLRQIDEGGLALNDRVWPEYVGWVMEHTNYYPAAPAAPATRPTEPGATPTSPTPRVVLVDLGFDDSVWNQARPTGLPNRDLEPPRNGGLSPAIGHGEAVAWILRGRAPGADVHGVSLVDLGRANAAAVANSPRLPAFTLSALRAALKAADTLEPDVLVVTSGFHVKESALPVDLLHDLDDLTGRMYVVASAGNEPGLVTLPAAHIRVTAVEARENNGQWIRTCYSAVGNVWAAGQHIVGFVEGTFNVPTEIHKNCAAPVGGPQVRFERGATVTGTSFAAPVIAAAIASGGRFDRAQPARRRIEAAPNPAGDFGVD